MHKNEHSPLTSTCLHVHCMFCFGLDTPLSASLFSLMQEDFNFTSQDSPASQLSYGKFQEIPELSVGSFPNSQPSVPVSEVSRTHYGAPSDRTTNFKSSSPSSRRGHTQTSNGPSKKYWYISMHVNVHSFTSNTLDNVNK